MAALGGHLGGPGRPLVASLACVGPLCVLWLEGLLMLKSFICPQPDPFPYSQPFMLPAQAQKTQSQFYHLFLLETSKHKAWVPTSACEASRSPAVWCCSKYARHLVQTLTASLRRKSTTLLCLPFFLILKMRVLIVSTLKSCGN